MHVRAFARVRVCVCACVGARACVRVIARSHGSVAPPLLPCRWQVLIGPHGGALQNMVYMRQPGHFGVAPWMDHATYGTTAGMGRGDPIPAVIELGPPLVDTPRRAFRRCFVVLANGLGLRYWLLPSDDFVSYYVKSFRASPTAVLDALGTLGLLK
jgi:hypothetical protein